MVIGGSYPAVFQRLPQPFADNPRPMPQTQYLTGAVLQCLVKGGARDQQIAGCSDNLHDMQIAVVPDFDPGLEVRKAIHAGRFASGVQPRA